MLHSLVSENKTKDRNNKTYSEPESESHHRSLGYPSLNLKDEKLSQLRQGQERAQGWKPISLSPLGQGRILQRKCACGNSASSLGTCTECEQKQEMPLQRKTEAGDRGNEVPPIVHDVLSSPGQSLDTETLAFMESRFNHDFSKVRVHTDWQAVRSARAVQSHAYTVGQHIVFSKDKYAPKTTSGRGLLAHELTHVIQQPSTSISRSSLKTSNPTDAQEQEADRVATKVLSEEPSVTKSVAVSVQRQHLMRDFDSTLYFCHALLNSRVFRVNNQIATATLHATRGLATTDAPDAEMCGSMPYYYITLTKKGLLFDSEISTHPVPFGYSTTRTWTGLDSGDYYFTIWTNNTNPYCCVDGTISVSTPSSEAIDSSKTTATLPSTACYNGDILYVDKGGSSYACPALTGTIGAPTPPGRYCIRPQGEAQVAGGVRGRILQDRDRWFLLEPLFPTSRFRMQLHPGVMSSGCITVMDRSCFDRLASVLNTGSTTSEEGYDGYPPGNPSGTVNPLHTVNCVGILTVTSNFGDCRSGLQSQEKNSD